jgi:TRAP-type C4-dicarboxylate transport system substrate-binding protein
MSLCKLGQNPQVYVASPIFLDKLPPDLKAVVIKGMKEAAKWHTAKVMEEDSTVVMPDLKAKGLQVNEVTAADLDKFRAAVKPVHDKWREKIGAQIYDESVAFLKKARQK